MNYGIQLQWIQSLHQIIRSRPLDLFFIGWSYVDTMGFVILVISFVITLINRKIGLKMFYVLMFGFVFMIFLKHLFAQPRPCQLDPGLGLRCSHTYGFPSGGAEFAFLYAGILWLECKKISWRIAGLIFAVILSFSRIYLGMHFFTDILGGWILGALLLAGYHWIIPICEKNGKIWAFLAPLVPFLLIREEGWGFPLILLGAALGLVFKLKQTGTTGCKIVQFLVTWIGSLGCFMAFLKGSQYTFFFAPLGGFWLIFLGEYIPLKIRQSI